LTDVDAGAKNISKPHQSGLTSNNNTYYNNTYSGQSISASMSKINDQEKRDEQNIGTTKRGSNIIEDQFNKK